MAIKIDIQKSYEEVDIAGNIYRMELNDDKLKEYLAAFNDFRKESEKLGSKNFSDMTDEEQKEATDKNYEIMERITDLMLQAGSFKVIYEATGRSLMVLTDIIFQLIVLVEKKTAAFKDKEKSYYTGK